MSLAAPRLYNSITLKLPTRSEESGDDGQEGAGKAKAKEKDSDGILVVARNRRAGFEFDLLEKVEAGIVLTGTEVKSLRTGKASLEEAYAGLDARRGLALRVRHPRVPPGQPDESQGQAAPEVAPAPQEIEKLAAKSSERGLTLVPLQIYFKKGMAKVEICIAKGRKLYDKREALKKQDAKRDIDRAVRGRG